MYPLLPFAAGIFTGVLVLRLLKADTTKAGLEKAQRGLRKATVSGLETIEGASARARGRLTGTAAAKAEKPVAKQSIASKPRRARATRKRAAKPSAEEAS
jgi:hypothetical protein